MYSKRIIIESIIGKTTVIKYVDKIHQSDKGIVELQVELKNQDNIKVPLDNTHLVSFMFVDSKGRLHQKVAQRFSDGNAYLILPEEVILTGGNVRVEIRFSKDGFVLGTNSIQFPIEATTIKEDLVTQFEPTFDILAKMTELYQAYDEGTLGGGVGIKGDTGEQGIQGIQGIQGEKGEKGDKGDTGLQGAKGDKGDTGAQGIQGVKGDKGDKGDAGVNALDTSPEIKEIARRYRAGTPIDTFKQSDWATMLGNITVDTVNVINGKESLRLVSSTAGEQPFIRSSRTLKLQNSSNIVLNVYINSEPDDLDGIALFLSNNSGFTNMIEYTFRAISLVKGWNRLVIPFNRMTVTGTGGIANDFVRMQVRVIPLSGKIADVTLDSVLVDTKQQANVIFTFDDQWDTQYSVAFAEMRQRGLKGTIGVNGINVGVTNYMTWNQLEEVYGYGWDLVNHTNEHYNLGQQSYAVQKKDIVDGRNALSSRGFTRASNILFLPYGSWNDTTMQILTEENIVFCRTIREQIETVPPVYKNKLKVKNLLPAVTAVSAQALVDDAIATGGTVIFLNHRFGTEDASNMFWDITKFQTLLNYVKTKQLSGEINVLTMSEWIKTF